MSDERNIEKCCMENISFVYRDVYLHDHLICDGCNTKWNIQWGEDE